MQIFSKFLNFYTSAVPQSRSNVNRSYVRTDTFYRKNKSTSSSVRFCDAIALKSCLELRKMCPLPYVITRDRCIRSFSFSLRRLKTRIGHVLVVDKKKKKGEKFFFIY